MRRLLPLLILGCGTRVDLPTVDGGGETSAADGAVADVGPVPCVDDNGRVPLSVKACSNDGECVVRARQADCCGSIVMVGIWSGAAAGFTKCEEERAAGLPLCDCVPQPTAAEDGREIAPGGAPAVRCEYGLCKTYVR